MHETRLFSAENFVSIGVDGQGKHITNDRQVVIVFLRNCEPINEHPLFLAIHFSPETRQYLYSGTKVAEL